MNLTSILMIIVSYLFGSVPWSLVIGLVFFKKDIRKEGSGNLGGTNAGRVLGKPVGITVVILDALKAFLSMMLCSLFAPDAVIYAGLACCIGHCFPIFAGFKGGKAVATSFGFFLGICVLLTNQYFWQFVFPILCFFTILFFCRMVSLSSILALLSAVIVSAVLKCDPSITFSIAALWAFVTYRHHENISRILSGRESRIKWMGKAPWEK